MTNDELNELTLRVLKAQSYGTGAKAMIFFQRNDLPLIAEALIELVERRIAMTCERCGVVTTRPDGAHYCHTKKEV